MKKNVNRLAKGLHSDNSPVDQPQQTYRFALNAINETEQGDLNFKSNAQSNERCTSIPEGLVPIGSQYMSNNETVLFFANELTTGDDQIAIIDDACNYTPILVGDLGFEVTHQIKSIFRLRRGCERTIYFTDNLNPVRAVNIDRPELYLTGGQVDLDKIKLSRSFSKIPIVETEVKDSGGQIEPGAVSVGFQYLDENFNATSVVTLTTPDNIYNESLNAEYSTITGSYNSDQGNLNFPDTNKSIEVTISNVNTDFAFYRLVFIEYTSSTGEISNIRYSDKISTNNTKFVYTGSNFVENGAVEDLIFEDTIIDTAESIEQIENRLVLANIKGRNIDYCALQKYASRITADVKVKQVPANILVEGNSKSPGVKKEFLGYQPGEIYAYNINYVFDDGFVAPGLHIPGKNPTLGDTHIFENGADVYPMSIDNTSQTQEYTDNSTCGTDLWGEDSEGQELSGENIRHHRFPLRKDIGVPLVEVSADNTSNLDVSQIVFEGFGNIQTPCSQDQIDEGLCDALNENAFPFNITINYTVDGVEESITHSVDPSDFTTSAENGLYSYAFEELSEAYFTNNANIEITSIIETDFNGNISVIASSTNNTNNIFDDQVTTVASADQDLDGIHTGADVDADGNGDPDDDVDNLYPGDFLVDTDGDGIHDLADADLGGVDTDLDGINDAYDIVDTNNDAVDDSLQNLSVDNDSDNDLIPDGADIDNRPTETDTDGDGIIDDADSDVDGDGNFEIDLTDPYKIDNDLNGIYDVYELLDSDGDFIPDAIDVDIDGDGNLDNGIDQNGDGIADGYAGRSFYSVSTNMRYTFRIEDSVQSTNSKSYLVNTLGIQFSNVVLPPKSVTNGREVVGYYITRLERTEREKTILDSAVLTPTVKNNRFIGSGILAPQGKTLYDKAFGLIHTENLFRDNQYTTFTNILQDGVFNVVDRKTSLSRVRDVSPGSSADGGSFEKGDNDGWSLRINSRDSELVYDPNEDGVDIDFNTDIDNVFYLKALESVFVNNEQDELYNVSADNKTCLVNLENPITLAQDKLPYVLIRRENANPYSNFRLDPYFKCSEGVLTGQTTVVFGGDTYISPMKYVNTTFYANRQASRSPKRGVFRAVLGALAVIAGAILIATGVGAAAGVALIGAGLTLASSGLKRENIAKAYTKDYAEGLQDTVKDNWTEGSQGFGYGGLSYTHNYGKNKSTTYSVKGPQDDEIQWQSEALSDLWFETQVNTQLRNSLLGVENTFMTAPSLVESGNSVSNANIGRDEIQNDFTRDSSASAVYVRDDYVAPRTALDIHLLAKLTQYDKDKKDKRIYNGLPQGEYYSLNPDYLVTSRQKPFFSLPLEFDCCSDCTEEFPQRIYYSDQSFQEDLSDNYRVFKPNNYRDLQGETGVITDLFKIKNNLYIHTEEALWYLPQNIQERITNDIVSFIGTGDFFSIPPRLIVDENMTSAGCTHTRSTLKTKHGVFFISERERKIYMFNGNELKGLTDFGHSKWLKDNLQIKALRQYYKSNQSVYEFDNNPSNKFGVGYVSTYDTEKDRIIFTKKDFMINSAILNQTDYRLAYQDNEVYIFSNYQQTIDSFIANGFQFSGIEGIRMVFQREVLSGNTVTIETQYVDGGLTNNFIEADNSFTISYYLKDDSFTSLHSYLPNFYYHINENFYSWIHNTNDNHFWRHNKFGNYQRYYDTLYPFILEYVSLSNTLQTRLWEDVQLQTEARRFDPTLNEFVDLRFETFNKGIFYNSRQCTGELELRVKDTNQVTEWYMSQQVDNNTPGVILLDRNERNWNLNTLRDIRVDYTQPIFNSELTALQSSYYIDKILNELALDNTKDWTELEMLRDKFLVIRLIFDKFDDVKLLINYSVETENNSIK